MEAYNDQARRHCEGRPNRYYFDIHPALLGPDGAPHAEFFQEDDLHLRPAAYASMGKLLQPYLGN